MKLMYLIPSTLGPGFEADEILRRREIIQKIAGRETEIDVQVSGEGPLSVESACDEAFCLPSIIRKAREVENAGYDGIIIGCAGDPGADALKEAVSIPVVGPAQASFAIASMLGRKFSVIAPVDGTVGMTLDLIAKYGFRDNFTSIRSASVAVLDIVKDPLLAEKRVFEESVCAKKDGADCIVLGCMSLAFSNFDEKLSRELHIPVINPVKAAVFVLEGIVKMNLAQSKIAFPGRGIIR